MRDIDSFAKQYPVTPDGIKFPPDHKLRRELFVSESMNHPAKMNLYLLQEIYRHVGEPGQTLMDISSGTGSLMMAALEGYQVICIEIEKVFYEMQKASLAKLGAEHGLDVGRVILIPGDCTKFLPIPSNHVVFSPPYAGVCNRGRSAFNEKARRLLSRNANQDAVVEGFFNYSAHPDNLGNLSDYFYNRQMAKIYELCYRSLPVGGTLTVVIQDKTDKGTVVELSSRAASMCVAAGFTVARWFMRQVKGTGLKALQRKKGFLTIDTENIIILVRQ